MGGRFVEEGVMFRFVDFHLMQDTLTVLAISSLAKHALYLQASLLSHASFNAVLIYALIQLYTDSKRNS
jgi:uncharacterized membrane protein